MRTRMDNTFTNVERCLNQFLFPDKILFGSVHYHPEITTPNG